MAIDDYYNPLFVSTPTQTVDEYGDAVTSYSDEREITGYVGKPASSQQFYAAQRGIDIDGRLYAPVEAGVKAFDIVRDVTTGYRYQVLSDPRDVAKRGHHVEANLSKWKGGATGADTQ